MLAEKISKADETRKELKSLEEGTSGNFQMKEASENYGFTPDFQVGADNEIQAASSMRMQAVM